MLCGICVCSGVVCITYVCVMECVGMRGVCVGGVLVGGRERRKCVVAQRDQTVIKKNKKECSVSYVE